MKITAIPCKFQDLYEHIIVRDYGDKVTVVRPCINKHGKLDNTRIVLTANGDMKPVRECVYAHSSIHEGVDLLTYGMDSKQAGE